MIFQERDEPPAGLPQTFRTRLAKPVEVRTMAPPDDGLLGSLDWRRICGEIDDDYFHPIERGLRQQMPQTTFGASALCSEDDNSRQDWCARR